MDIIPVIDVRGGEAVHAVGGQRHAYQPLNSPLAASNDPVDVALGYKTLWNFSSLYLADLDAIEGLGHSTRLVERLTRALPNTAFWVDCGLAALTTEAVWPPNAISIIGSESLQELPGMFPPQAILSLDFKNDGFLGPAELLERSQIWPQRVIVMTLGHVGRNAGPDLDRIGEVAKARPDISVYAAGGVRDVSDCRAAREHGATGVLIASALHRQNIKASDLDEIAGL